MNERQKNIFEIKVTTAYIHVMADISNIIQIEYHKVSFFKSIWTFQRKCWSILPAAVCLFVLRNILIHPAKIIKHTYFFLMFCYCCYPWQQVQSRCRKVRVMFTDQIRIIVLFHTHWHWNVANVAFNTCNWINV